MATRRKTYNSDPLDELLEKLNSGEFVDQSVYEFNETVNDTVKSYHDSRRSGGTKTRYQRATYSTVRPIIKPEIETADYNSRFQQCVTCLENQDYRGYPASKKDGYQEATNRYIGLIKDHPNDLRAVEQQCIQDSKTCQSKLRTVTVDGFTQGYYDALLMVRKVLSNSKLARLRELSNKLK